MTARHGGQILVDALKAQGVPRVFSVPGESFLAVLDGLYESGIDNIVCRHEGAAAMMAEATGKLTGRPGIALVTRGPGATNASAGVHVAQQDSTPMILLIGQIARADRDRGAFQEVDYRAMFGGLAKWVAEVDDTRRIPEYLARAFQLAMNGRPGPVVLSLPEDVLSAEVDIPDLPPASPRVAGVAPEAVAAVLEALEGAERPLIVPGGSLWDQAAADALRRFAEGRGLPVAVPFRRQGHMDNRSPAYVGDLATVANPGLALGLKGADLVVLLGSRLGDIATGGFSLMDPARPGPRVVQVHPSPDELGHLWVPRPGIVADPRDMVAALAGAPVGRRWDAHTAALRAAHEAWLVPRQTPGAVKLEAVVRWLSDNLPEDAIVTNGAGNYAAWVQRYFRFKRAGTQVASTSGSMGYCLPAALAAGLAHPDRLVVCMAGDGCLQMTLNEFSTARQQGLAPVVIVANNGQYGTIRMHQEKTYPGRVSGTALANPDFAALARAYGGFGVVVEDQADFAGAFEAARAAGTLAVIELRLDPEALSPGASLAETRAKAAR